MVSIPRPSSRRHWTSWGCRDPRGLTRTPVLRPTIRSTSERFCFAKDLSSVGLRGSGEDLWVDVRRRRSGLRGSRRRLDRPQLPSSFGAYVAPEIAADIIAALPSTVAAVGVFVDRPAAEVAELAVRLGLGIVQLHGQEPPEDLVALTQLRVIRAFRLRSALDWERISDFLARAVALGRPLDAVLVDAFVAGQPGGTGALIAETLLDHSPPLPHLILAGGLTPRNVAERIARVRPWMVDVASGVESAPGRKDPAAVAAFIRAVRGAPITDPAVLPVNAAFRRPFAIHLLPGDWARWPRSWLGLRPAHGSCCFDLCRTIMRELTTPGRTYSLSVPQRNSLGGFWVRLCLG